MVDMDLHLNSSVELPHFGKLFFLIETYFEVFLWYKMKNDHQYVDKNNAW